MFGIGGKSVPPVAPLIVGAAFLAALSFGGGILFATHSPLVQRILAPAGAPDGIDFSPVWKAWQIIDDNYVPVAVASSTPVEATSTAAAEQEKVWGMISGLTASLNDPYSYFLPPTENKEFTSDMSGSFEGVGMEIDVKDGVLTIISPLKGTPAEAAGIKSGDQVLKIDGVDTKGIDTTTAVQEIRGPKGTQVTLTVLRTGWDVARDIKVTRDIINVPVVTTKSQVASGNQPAPGIFLIGLSTFTSNSADLFRDGLRQFVESGDTKLILDLRGNPGGYLDAAVDIASWFLPSGEVIVTENYDGHGSDVVHRSLGYDVFNKNLKMVILVDKGSASASEILASALRYYGVAKLVGTNTYGKGSVQELINITPDTALKLTVARWLPPDGTPIPVSGIVPDVQVDLTDADITAGKDPQMAKAIEILNAQN